jgi:hypothetical protein
VFGRRRSAAERSPAASTGHDHAAAVADFHQRCRRLAEAPWRHVLARLTVAFEPAATSRPRHYQAAGAATHDRDGADPANWLSHEFEPLIEQTDGVSVMQLVDDPLQPGQVTAGLFETGRAVRAGEVHGKRGHDKFVD